MTTDGLKHVLVVEDDPAVGGLVSQALAGHYRVHRAIDAEHARTLLEQLPRVDVIVSDAMMPGASGLDLARWLEGQPHLSHIPVIFLTARSSARTKPFKVTDLLDEVARAAGG